MGYMGYTMGAEGACPELFTSGGLVWVLEECVLNTH